MANTVGKNVTIPTAGPNLGAASPGPHQFASSASMVGASDVQRRQLASVATILKDAGLGGLTVAAAVATVFAPEIMGAGPDEALAAADLAALNVSAEATAGAAIASGESASAAASLAHDVTATDVTSVDEVSANAMSDLSAIAADAPVGKLASGAPVPDWFSAASAWTDKNLAAAAKAVQKHGDRISSWFPKMAPDGSARMAQARDIIDSIREDPTAVAARRNNKQYGDFVDIVSNNGDGVGVRYSEDRGFVGLLEPGFLNWAGQVSESNLFS